MHFRSSLQDASIGVAVAVIGISLLISLLVYLRLSKHEGSYVNILSPSFLIAIPAYYLLPLVYIYLFGTSASSYAYLYVYLTLAAESLAFVYAYVRTGRKIISFPLGRSYERFAFLSIACLLAGTLTYLPLMLKFRQYLLDPRQIYIQTRTGFGTEFYISSTLAYLAVILILFARCSRVTKTIVVLAAVGLLSLHGSKGETLAVPSLLLLFFVYVRGRKIKFSYALVLFSITGIFGLLLFAATMTLTGGLVDILDTLSSYSDYTRNAMLVIDSHVPLQYGRLTFEANTLAVVPRALDPGKPKNFGPMFLAEQFYPESLDADAGSPAFGVGVQYADFGYLAIVYIIIFGMLRGWMARVFVNRLALMKHPADFLMVAFLADITLFPVGVGWLLPETIVVAMLLSFLSSVGARKVYRERIGPRFIVAAPEMNPLTDAGSSQDD
jgi:hypothetical protein